MVKVQDQGWGLWSMKFRHKTDANLSTHKENVNCEWTCLISFFFKLQNVPNMTWNTFWFNYELIEANDLQHCWSCPIKSNVLIPKLIITYICSRDHTRACYVDLPRLSCIWHSWSANIKGSRSVLHGRMFQWCAIFCDEYGWRGDGHHCEKMDGMRSRDSYRRR